MKNKGIALLSLILVLGTLGLVAFGLYYLIISRASNNPVSVVVTPSPLAPRISYKEWKTYTSPRFHYELKYPETWTFTPFDEANPKILEGSHSLSSYDMQKVHEYQDHGIIDWKRFLGTEPAWKIDIHVTALKTSKEAFLQQTFAEATKVETPDRVIGTYETLHYVNTETPSGTPVNSYVSFIEDRAIVLSVYQFNPDSPVNLRGTESWEQVSGVLQSFTFK